MYLVHTVNEIKKKLQWEIKKNSGFSYSASIDYSSDKIVSIGKQSNICKFCDAKLWAGESKYMCCANGKVKLANLTQPPKLIMDLLNGTHPNSAHFLSAIRQYNSCFAMTSFGAKIIKENYMPTFKVQGQIYHNIGSLLSSSEKNPAFLQIFFVEDSKNEAKIRLNIFSDLNLSMINKLQTLLHRNNRYIRDFKTALEMHHKEDDFKIMIKSEKKSPTSISPVPTLKEISVLMTGDIVQHRDIIIHKKSNEIKRICELHRSYDPLQYPLMFPFGDEGYSINLELYDPINEKHVSKKVSSCNYYAFRIMERNKKSNYLLMYRNLFNQYLVDMFAKIETERLNYLRFNQPKLRVENYIHLKDAVNDNDANPSNIGQKFILPSSHTGSPRYLFEEAQDTMVYVRAEGRPDLFITFTCNPKWEEIQECLKSGQKPQDRHDILARVFNLKVKKMIDLLRKNEIFGPVKCFVSRIEWQRRGLPHTHILCWLKDKIKAHQIDSIISAQIPNPSTDPELHELVKSHMIHGPCGSLNENSPCMNNGICSKNYPRNFLDETRAGEDSYPTYKRLSPDNGGFTTVIKHFKIDNSWVVPYNPVLLKTSKAHVNVEICNSVKSIKYICKYVHKKSDEATCVIENKNDEIQQFQSGRFISSSEAVWRILTFKIHNRYPPVMHLSVHGENEQRVYFTPKNMSEIVANPPQTTLIGFFKLCQVDSFARNLLYNEVPQYYTWAKGKFNRRQRGETVENHPEIKKQYVLGRVYTVHPNNYECYFLRLLLHHVRGPLSFEFLRTVGGVVHPSFQSACFAHGLLENDENWDATLEEAVIGDSPKKLRDLFAVMIVFCQLSNPMHLWNKYKDSFSEDVQRKLTNKNTIIDDEIKQKIENETLILLEETVIRISNNRLNHYNMCSPTYSQNYFDHSFLAKTASGNNSKRLDSILATESSRNKEQIELCDYIINSINSNEGGFAFLDAYGGTGKTFTINYLLAKLIFEGQTVISVASSGIAATLLLHGRTAHSAFKLPLNLNSADIHFCNISKQSKIAELLKTTSFIVWDEITMAHRAGVEALDRTLQDIRNDKRRMGGVTTLLSGDFRQTLPVIPRGTRANEIDACIKSSYLWNDIKVFKLHQNMRVDVSKNAANLEFANVLLKIGNGLLEEIDGKINIKEIPCNHVTELTDLINNIYPDIENIHIKETEWFEERAILSPTNDRGMEINDKIMLRFHERTVTYVSVDSTVETEDALHYPAEFLNSLTPSGTPPHILTLKEKSPIIMLRNLLPPILCNGTRLQIIALRKNTIEAKILTGDGKGQTTFIPKIPMIPNDYPFQFKRIQFPIRLAFAISINKSQGQSLTYAGIDLRDDCFSHGQLYVACSRAKTPVGLSILQPTGKTKNIVYREVL
nr:PREDICTED: uncharacterized protein LOC109039193 [Bemisia tabaci]